MVDVFDEVAARREAFRAPTGQFGAMPQNPPEMELASTRAKIEQLISAAIAARDRMSRALFTKIDATMPAEADFVNYDFHPKGHRLIIREAIGGYGEELDLEPFAHIDSALEDLGQPYLDFDGDLALNSLDDFGWERNDPYSDERDAAARAAADASRELWRHAILAQQQAAVDALWPLMGDDVEALDFTWDETGKSLKLAAVIRHAGRMEVGGAGSPQCDELTAHLTEPEHMEMRLNELSGLYRLAR